MSDDSGDKFFLKCRKCFSWYTASCHWHRMYDKILYTPRDKKGNLLPWKDDKGQVRYGEVEMRLPHIVIENVEQHQCEKGKAKYDV